MTKPPRFHTRPFPGRRRKRSWWTKLRPFLLFALVMAIAAIAMRWQTVWHNAELRVVEGPFVICGQGRQPNCVVDGDTLMLGPWNDRRRIRLQGYDAPELKGACPAESALALKARDALLRWLNAGPVELDGGDNPPLDQYQRELRAAARTGPGGSVEWLSEHMIEAELAEGSGWGSLRRDWC